MRYLISFIFLIVFSTFISAQSSKFKTIENEINENIKHGKWDDVIILSTDLLIENPAKGDGYYYASIGFLKLNNIEKAKIYIEKAEQIADSDLLKKTIKVKADIQLVIDSKQISKVANEHENAGNTKKAAEEWERLWLLDKSKVEYVLNAINIYVVAKNYPKALELLNDDFIKDDPNSQLVIEKINKSPEMIVINGYDFAMKSGKEAFNSKQFTSAMTFFEKALTFKSNDYNANALLTNSKDENAWVIALKENAITSYENYVN